MTEHGSYWVASHVRVCVTASGSVALDLRRSRYTGIGDLEARALAALARNWRDISAVWHDLPALAADEARAIAPGLVSAGFLTEREPALDIPNSVLHRPPVFTSVGFEIERRVSIRANHLIAFARSYVWAQRSLRARSIEDMASELRRAGSGCLPENRDRLLDAVSVFRRLRPYSFTAREKCLLHALALCKFLTYQKVRTSLIMAVRMRPWAAHSWVECGPLLLDAKPDEIAGFFPIVTI